MDRTLSPNTKSQQPDKGKSFLQSAKKIQQQDFAPFAKARGINSLSRESGFDLTQIPIKPGLKTIPRVQCCGKDGGPCSCPKCKEAKKESEESEAEKKRRKILSSIKSADSDAEPIPSEGISPDVVEENADNPEQTPAGPDNAPGDAEETPAADPQSQSMASEEKSTKGLIVEDSETGLSDGQMTKRQFLQKLRTEICNAIEPVVSKVGQTAENCPYLNYWLDLYQEKSASHIEQTARKYAPDTAGAKSAEEYTSIITQRAVRAAEIWAKTGKITGVPEGVPTTLPGESKEEKEPEVGAVQAKSKSGGVKNAEDPQAIQKQLGEGQPLAADIRSRMESAFGISFSHVRTHTDSVANELSSRVNARAFTVGNHVAFGNDEYKPGTVLGEALIAHELAHTIQQGSAVGSINKMESGSAGYDALEADADKAAFSVISSLWKPGQVDLDGIVKNAIPRLRSGLRISRCGDKATKKSDPAKEPEKKEPVKDAGAADAAKDAESTVTAGVTHGADMKCEPFPKTLDEVQAASGSAGTLGYTKANPIELNLGISSDGKNCSLQFPNDPRLSYQHFVYTKPGDYKVGTANIADGACAGKSADLYYRFTAPMSDKIRKGEIEHCEDHKLAFALSYERFAKAAREVATTTFAGADTASCQTETLKRLKEKTGIDVSSWKAVADCLMNKTLERDQKSWHTVSSDPQKGNFILSPDCKKVVFEFDHTKQLPDVGNHPSKDVVKGCGEKP